MGSMTFAAMLGLVNYLHSGDKLIFDAIPVDYVSNLILAAAAKTALSPPGTLNVMHSTSSKQHPATVKFIVDKVMDYTKHNPSMKQIFQPSLTRISNLKVYDSLFFTTQQLPVDMLILAAQLPVIGSEKKRN
jgi:hypothetical protein